jgi:hypothetical protein
MKYREPTIIIPALEAMVRPTREWTGREDAIIRQYYRRVPTRDLAVELNRECKHNRSTHAVQCRAQILGVTVRGNQEG